MLTGGQVEDQRSAGAAVIILQVDGLDMEDLVRVGADLVVVLQADILIAPDALEDDLGQGLVGGLAVDENAALEVPARAR